MRKICVIIYLCLLGSCGLSKNIETSLDTGFHAILTTQITFVQKWQKPIALIYEKDSLELGRPIFMRQLDVVYMSDILSFELKLDSAEVTWGKDSVLSGKKVTIAGDHIVYNKKKHKVIAERISNDLLGKDSISLTVSCDYLPDMNITGDRAFKHMRAEYIYVIEDQLPILKEQTVIWDD